MVVAMEVLGAVVILEEEAPEVILEMVETVDLVLLVYLAPLIVELVVPVAAVVQEGVAVALVCLAKVLLASVGLLL
jgi:hypothetical protein